MVEPTNQPPTYSRTQSVDEPPPLYTRHSHSHEHPRAGCDASTDIFPILPVVLPLPYKTVQQRKRVKICILISCLVLLGGFIIGVSVGLATKSDSVATGQVSRTWTYNQTLSTSLSYAPSTTSVESSVMTTAIRATATPILSFTSQFIASTAIQSSLAPVQSTTFNLPNLPIGKFSIPFVESGYVGLFLRPIYYKVTYGCDAGRHSWDDDEGLVPENSPWGCSNSTDAYNITLSIVGGRFPVISLAPTTTSMTKFELTTNDSSPGIIHTVFPPTLEALPLTLTVPTGTSPDSNNYDIGYHFQTTFDKLVIAKSSIDNTGISWLDDNQLWFCWWNGTLLEGTVYPMKQITGDYPAGSLPMKVELREGRVAQNHGLPYCELMSIDWPGNKFTPLLDERGGRVVMTVNETTGDEMFKVTGHSEDLEGCTCSWGNFPES